MTQPPTAMQSRARQPELGKDPISAKAEPGTFFPGRIQNLCSLDAKAEMFASSYPPTSELRGSSTEVLGQTLQASGWSHLPPSADSGPTFLHMSWQGLEEGGLLQITSCLWHKPLPGLKSLNRTIRFCVLTVATPEQWQDCSTTWPNTAGVPKATRKGLRAEAFLQD